MFKFTINSKRIAIIYGDSGLPYAIVTKIDVICRNNISRDVIYSNISFSNIYNIGIPYDATLIVVSNNSPLKFKLDYSKYYALERHAIYKNFENVIDYFIKDIDMINDERS